MPSAALKQTIQAAYSSYLAKRGFKARPGQKQMLAQVARTLGSLTATAPTGRALGVIEAGTGIGKTIGYLISAIPIAQSLNLRLVIATATVTLQEQLVSKDLPELFASTDLEFNAVLAKGRGRYLCTLKLEQLIQLQAGAVAHYSLFEQEATADEAALREFSEMMRQFGAGDWSGDLDQWPQSLGVELNSRITSSHRECLQRSCPHYRHCPFFAARDQLQDADVIVANHDLVMADLALGGGAILPAPEETLYIFDEGHQLPEKALRVMAASLPLQQLAGQLESWQQQLPKLEAALTDAATVKSLLIQLAPVMAEVAKQLEYLKLAVQPWLARITAQESAEILPDVNQQKTLAEQLEPLERPLTQLTTTLGASSEQLRKLLNGTTDAVQQERWQGSLPQLGRWLARAESAQALIELWRTPDEAEREPTARWLQRPVNSGQDDLVLNASPVSASRILRTNLWNRCRGAIVTSATLTIEGRFANYLAQAGISESAATLCVPSPFDYSRRVQAIIPAFAVSGSDKPQHSESIRRLIEQSLPPQAGNLVLFSSRVQMNEVYQALPKPWQTRITCQDEMAKSALLAHHRERLDQGVGSTLFGLASLAEGVDLPGAYLTNLVIAKIPFAVPDDPILATLSNWLEQQGRNPFQALTLPAAIIRMVQACGRLIRSETDEGTIWLMDRRLVDKGYGRSVRNSLPAYRWQIEQGAG